MSASAAISCSGLTKFYGPTRGIEDLELEVMRGELFGFLGPNGAGKTTTIRLLLDFIRPTRGHLYDRASDELILVSVTQSGAQGDGESARAKISAYGDFVMFTSTSSNFVASDTNGSEDIFVKDLASGAVERVSVWSGGRQMRRPGGRLTISEDGRYVAATEDNTAFWRDRATDVTRSVTSPYYSDSGSDLIGLTRDGRTITFGGRTDAVKEGRVPPGSSTTSYGSIYQQTMPGGSPRIVSISDNGVDIQNPSGYAVTPDGNMILFNYNWSAYVRDLEYRRTSLVAPGSFTTTTPQGGSIAGNGQSITLTIYNFIYARELYALEFLRDGFAQGRAWYAGWRQGVNTGTGNYVTSATDVRVTTVGGGLEVTRHYNSNAYHLDGVFGRGFSGSYDYSLEKAGEGMVVRYPDGRALLFTGRDTYSAPKGTGTRLVKNADETYQVTEVDGSTTNFDSAGRLTHLADPQGHRTNVAYSPSGEISTITEAASGRKLTFEWSGGHVSAVRTDPVTDLGGPLTWTYNYDGDRLTKACAPPTPAGATRCTRYGYTDGRLSEIYNAYDERTAAITYQADGRVATSATDGVNASTFNYGIPGTTEITDAAGRKTTHVYDDAGRLVRQVDPAGKAMTFTYDNKGFPASVTDENGNKTTTTYSSSGDKLSETTGINPSVPGASGKTAHLSYDSEHNLLAKRDRRSSSATDNAFKTTYTYDGRHNVTSETSPPLLDFPNGVTKSWTYSTGSEAAIGGGTVPAGLMLTATDERGKATTYRYDSKGDLREIENPKGALTKHTYNEVGWLVSMTAFSDAFPDGVRTEFGYDELGHVVRETGPLTHDEVTEEPHRLEVRHDFDRAGRLTSVTQDDIAGSDPTRVTSYGADQAGRVASVTDNETNATESYVYDAVGNVSLVTDKLGRQTRIDYTVRNQPERFTRLAVSLRDGTGTRDVVVETRTYDDGGRLKTQTDAIGRTRRYDYDTDNRLTKTVLLGYRDVNGTTRDVVLEEAVYNAAGHVAERRLGNGRRVEHFTRDALGRVTKHVLDPSGLNRATNFTFDEAGNELSRELTDGTRSEVVRHTYDALGNPLTETVENGAADLTTWFDYDDRGALTATTDARGSVVGDPGFTTDYVNDELGRPVEVIALSVTVEEFGSLPASARPTTVAGYDAFGQAVHARDARGSVTTMSYDKLGRHVRTDLATYQRPDGTTLQPYEASVYDDADRLIEQRDRRGGLTNFVYDGLDHLAERLDPAVSLGRPTTVFHHDDAGRLTKTIDPVGAVVRYEPDMLDRVRTETEVVGALDGGPSQEHVTTYDYDDLGYLRSMTDAKDEVSTYEYSVAGELTKTTDPLNKITTQTYDMAGREKSATDPLGRKVEYGYDLAGRRTDVRSFDPSGALVSHSSADYDAVDNQVASVSAGGHAQGDLAGFTTTSRYDAMNRLLSITEPVSATEHKTQSFGYDTGGLVTRTTDGRGHGTGAEGQRLANASDYDTFYMYNSWGLPVSTIEPATDAHPNLVDRKWVTTYDEAGLPAAEQRPGGVLVSRVYDALGNLTSETGEATNPLDPSAPDAATRTRTYDLAGRLRTANHPDGTLNFDYDDRGLLVESTGPAGTASFRYDSLGRMSKRIDAAGTHDFSYTDRSELDTASDPLTGVTLDLSYDDAGQLTSMAYGSTGTQRTFTYDTLGRLDVDRLEEGATPAFKTDYDYDADGNVTAQSIDLPGTADDASHSYTYDRSSRIKSWTKPNATTVDYGWDAADNRISVGTQSFVFDERNRLTQGPQGTYDWSARGTLESIVDGGTTKAFEFDALDRMVGAAGVTYSYDGLDRVAERGTTSFTYAGAEIDPVSDGTTTYGRGPSGSLVSMEEGTTSRLVGLNRHGDVAFTVGASGSVGGTHTYGPFGEETASTGTGIGKARFQADYTDPTTGLTWMGARWYDPAIGGFTARDTMARDASSQALVNRYGYAGGNPVTMIDPDGRCTTNATGWGGCTPHVGPGSYHVRMAVGIYTDSSSRLYIPPPPRPEPQESSSDGEDSNCALGADICMLEQMHYNPGLTYRKMGNLVTTVSQAVKQAVDYTKRLKSHLNDLDQLRKDAVNAAAAIGNGLYKTATDALEFMGRATDAMLNQYGVDVVPEFNFKDEGPFSYKYNDARSREFTSAVEFSAGMIGAGALKFAKWAGGKIATGLGKLRGLGKLDNVADTGSDVAAAAARADRVDVMEGISSFPPRNAHSRYADGTYVLEGQQPPRFGTAVPDSDAVGAAHSRLRWDDVNGRLYQAREFDEYGNPVRDIDFTMPTYPNGTPRPNHSVPEQHRWVFNDPAIGPKAGYYRVRQGEPL